TAMTTTNGNERFNAEAAAWDNNPDVHRASEGALQAILAAQPPILSSSSSSSLSSAEVLEIGCGTGLLTLRLAPHVSSILAIDAAEGMIDALRLKLDRLEDDSEREDKTMRTKVHPLCIMLQDPEDPRLPPNTTTATTALDGKMTTTTGRRKKFDLVISHLVLHHIADLRALLVTMHGCLKPGGELALTDFEDFGPEARKFHPESKMFGVERHGINREWFAAQMAEVGFEHVDVKPSWTMNKEVERFPGEWGDEKPTGKELATMGFPFLLCRGWKAS
ncbi:hypothetical protein M406DRAFT_43603, partial [Cryphonectria parasitica EP155]